MMLKRINKKGNASDVITKRFSFLSRKINFEITTFRIYKMSEKINFFKWYNFNNVSTNGAPTNCIYEARALGFHPPGANAN